METQELPELYTQLFLGMPEEGRNFHIISSPRSGKSDLLIRLIQELLIKPDQKHDEAARFIKPKSIAR